MDSKQIKDVCERLAKSGTGATKLPAVAEVLRRHSDKDRPALTKELASAGLGSVTIDKIFDALK